MGERGELAIATFSGNALGDTAATMGVGKCGME